MFGISVAAILGVSECPDDEPIHKHGFIQVFRFSILMKDTMISIFTWWLWFPGTDEQGLSLEAPWKVIIGHDRPPLYLGMGWITVDDWTGNSRLAGGWIS